MTALVLFRTLLLFGNLKMFEMKCKPTSSDIYGPYYYPNSPHLKRFCQYVGGNETDSDSLFVFGRVYASDCKSPLPEVKIEMWQADHGGEYKNSTGCRGYLKTDKYGFYELDTIYPGKYTFGDDFRPAHLHFKINGIKGHKSLVTQMYFSKDDHLGPADPCMSCSSGENDLVTKLRRTCKKQYCFYSVEFNITLSKGDGEYVSPVTNPEDNEIC